MKALHVSVLMRILISKYIGESKCVTILTLNNLHHASYLPTINLNITKFENDETNFEQLFDNIYATMKFGCEMFVIESHRIGDIFYQIEKAIKRSDRRLNKRKYIFIPSELLTNELDVENVRTKMFQFLNSTKDFYFIPDLLFVLPVHRKINFQKNRIQSSLIGDNDDVYELITHRYVTKYNWQDIVFLDYWFSVNNSFLHNSDLFPNKMADLQGKPMRIASLDYKPYVVFEVDGKPAVDGVETRVVIQYAERRNASIEIIDDEVEKWGHIFDNWTGEGLLGNIVEDRADCGIGAIYMWLHEYIFLDFSTPTIRAGVSCLCPTPKLIVSLLAPLFPFEVNVWFAISGFLVVLIFMWKIIIYFTHKLSDQYRNVTMVEIEKTTNRYTWVQTTLTIIGLHLFQPIAHTQELVTPRLRYTLVCLLLLCVVLSCSYGSGLASSMTVPRYEKPIDTNLDLAKRDLLWAAPHDVFLFSIENAKEPHLVTIRNNFRALSFDELKRRTFTEDIAFAVERLQNGHLSIGPYITEEALPYLRLMRSDIYWDQCVVMLRKSSAFKPDMDELIGRLQSSGLLAAWEGQVVRAYLNNKLQLGAKLSMSKSSQDSVQPVKLRFAHIEGIYTAWAIGMGICIVCFIGELAVYKLKHNYVRKLLIRLLPKKV